MNFPYKIKTQRTAVKYSIIMWRYLVDNPSKDKHDVPGYHGHWIADCALCELFEAEGCIPKSKCQKCPLVSDLLCGFGGHKSAYKRWYDALSSKTKEKYAKIILNALLEYKKKKGWD